MFLVRMVYCSKISEQFNATDIDHILESARRNNHKKHVTGLLCFNRKYFLQCLEGGRQSVNEIYRKILNDPRHEDVVMLNYSEITRREFENWNMAYLPEKKLTDEVNLKFSGNPNFDPFSMHGESTFELMLALSKTIPTV